MNRKPNFFVVGAPKCGTTALYEFLKGHPDIFLPIRKELNYFSDDIERTQYSSRVQTLEEYLNYYGDAQNQKAIGDTSASYLHSRVAAHRLYEFDNDARIMIMLRNPVDAMYALYSQMRFNGNEILSSLEEALEAESERKVGQNLHKHVRVPENLLYRERTQYSHQIERYMDVFPKEQIHIILQDDLINSSESTYRKVLQFLDVDDSYQPDFRKVNSNKQVKHHWLQRLYQQPFLISLSKRFPKTAQHVYGLLRKANTEYTDRQPLNPELRRSLLQEYQNEIDTLSQIVQRDLSYWYKDN